MNGAALLLALATLGVDYGWQLDKDGQLEYIIQIPPTQLESLRDRPEGISSSIPPEVVRHVKRFRIVVGSNPLPRDPLPAFSDTNGNVTPINVDASRVNPAGADFPLPPGDDNNPLLGQPALQSTVTPLDDNGLPRAALPGPAPEIPGNPNDAIDDILISPALPRSNERREDFGASSATKPLAVIRQGQLDAGMRPNVNSPGIQDTWGNTASSGNSFGQRPSPFDSNLNDTSARGSALARNRNTSFASSDPFRSYGKEPMYPSLALTVLALCLSIGVNIYLGWVAWGYYMRYRETFESWRAWPSSQPQ